MMLNGLTGWLKGEGMAYDGPPYPVVYVDGNYLLGTA